VVLGQLQLYWPERRMAPCDLDALGGAKFFSSFDFLSGYWQIEIEEEDKPKTGFLTIYGLFEFNVMPFGLTSAPSTFQRAMDDLLRRIKWIFCLVYIDDVIIYSKTEKDHLKHLDEFLKIVQDNEFKLKAKKLCTLSTHKTQSSEANWNAVTYG